MTIAAGIIAAGEGSRLAGSHPNTIKPLIPVAGKPLIHWVVGALRSSGCREVAVLANSRGDAVGPYLSSNFPDVPFLFLSADTASSFESFRLVSLRLADGNEDFLISTVDALMRPADIARFAGECRASGADAGLALTRHVDDEKPLWADVDGAGRVTAVGPDAKTRRAVTSGLYYMTRAAARALPGAAAHGRLRDFWTSLVASGARVSGVILSTTLDVDRPEDVLAAESFLVMGEK
ncbi:MAG: NTP transferase domain-containing protein [Elusimicrobia bacterium]|nr:NTP transferase domain-containing protein [Elusimicrobiota bacterium]